MKNLILPALAVLCLVSSSASAQTQLTPTFFIPTVPTTPTASAEATATSTPTPTPFSPEHLKGMMGVGIGTTPLGATALALRVWIEDDTALDLMVSGSDTPSTGYSFSGNEMTLSNWGYGLSLGLKQNLREPVKDVFIQGIGRLSFAQNYGQNYGYTTSNGVNYGYSLSTTQNQELNLFLGLGFEAFIPFWSNLSLEGSVGLSVNAIWNEFSEFYNPNFSSNQNYQTSYGFLNGGIGTNTFSLLNGSVHFYF